MVTDKQPIIVWIYDLNKGFLRSYNAMLQIDSDPLGRVRPVAYDPINKFDIDIFRIDLAEDGKPCRLQNNYVVIWTSLTSHITYVEILKLLIGYLDFLMNNNDDKIQNVKYDNHILFDRKIRLNHDLKYAIGEPDYF